MAMLKLSANPDWISIGGRFLIPVHDELIVEVPFENRFEGARILKESMEQAGSFLPFTISCDIEETFRWYGLSVEDILSFERPTSLDFDNLSESNIQWLQSRLVECEYILPVYKGEDGSKPIGIAAKGVNGIWSDDISKCIDDYVYRYNIQRSDFINHIDNKVCGYFDK